MFNLFDDLFRVHRPIRRVYITNLEKDDQINHCCSCNAYIDSVMFNGTATIVKWTDGVITRSVCHKDDKFDAEKGLAMAIAKRHLKDAGVTIYDDFFKEIINNKDNYVQPKQKKQTKKSR